MADVKVSALAAGTGITDADLFYYIDGTTSKKVTALIVKNYVLDSILIGINANANPSLFWGTGAGASDLDGCAGSIGIGQGAMTAATTSDTCVCIGYYAGLGLTTGDDNTLIGAGAGVALTTQSGCVCIGKNAGAANTTANLLFIDNSNTATPLIWGNFAGDIATIHGQLGINIKTPATSAAVDITSTTGALLVPRMTTTQRDALTEVNGMIIYNSTTNDFNFYVNGNWITYAPAI